MIEATIQNRNNHGRRTKILVTLKGPRTNLEVTLLLIAFYFGWIDFYHFIVYFVGSYLINIILFFAYIRLAFALRLR